MAKDPAILFYTSDFLTGTFTMTDEQVGRYIKLLCLQHQKGTLTIQDMEFVCKGKDPVVFAKFESDSTGNYFNKTLKEHSEKRKTYSESRRNNRSKKHMNNISNTYDSHMENVNENVIVNTNDSKGGVGESKSELIEIFFNDLPNCSYIETISRNTKLTKDQVLGYIPSFRLKADVTYPSFDRFVNHFKNFINLEKNGKQKFTSDRQERLSSLDNLENLAESLLRGDQSGVGS